MTTEERNEYLNFMYDPKNLHHCEGCPENHGFESGADGNTLPCGQYHCWVAVHCGIN